jgi:small-conductance mechanosensitive channel
MSDILGQRVDSFLLGFYILKTAGQIFMSKPFSNFLVRALFIAASVGLAWYAWSSWLEALPQYKNETLIIPTLLLYALTFPASLVVQLLYTGLALVTPIDQFDMGTTYLNWMLTTWGPLTFFGYLQWFVLVPRLIRYRLDRD